MARDTDRGPHPLDDVDDRALGDPGVRRWVRPATFIDVLPAERPWPRWAVSGNDVRSSGGRPWSSRSGGTSTAVSASVTVTGDEPGRLTRSPALTRIDVSASEAKTYFPSVDSEF